jgi:hypothetical protein
MSHAFWYVNDHLEVVLDICLFLNFFTCLGKMVTCFRNIYKDRVCIHYSLHTQFAATYIMVKQLELCKLGQCILFFISNDTGACMQLLLAVSLTRGK